MVQEGKNRPGLKIINIDISILSDTLGVAN
jgi:hypothetical protein